MTKQFYQTTSREEISADIQVRFLPKSGPLDLDIASTSKFKSIKSKRRCDPMNPEAPVIRTLGLLIISKVF